MGNLLLALLLTVAAPAFAGPAPADFFLIGAQLYSCDGLGTNGGPGAFADFYQYSTNSGTSREPLFVNGIGSSISFPLYDGENTFTYATSGIGPGDYGCLNLFFSESSDSFNPPYEAGVPIPGDLAVVARVGGAFFAFVPEGVNVQSYNSTGVNVNATSYAGASSVGAGNARVATVTAFSIAPNVTGGFTITVPEPTGAAALAVLSLLALAARRR